MSDLLFYTGLLFKWISIEDNASGVRLNGFKMPYYRKLSCYTAPTIYE